MMENVNNVPELRFGEFGGLLRQVKFGSEIKNSGYGPRFNGNDYDINGNVKTIRGTDISNNGEIKYEQVPIAKLDDILISNHILEEGDLVMITTADCGLTGVFRKQNINYIPSAYAVKIKLKTTSDSIYFKYFFQTSTAKNQINRFIRKATVANLPGSDISKIKLNLPTLPEQQKIATFLTSVDKKIEQLTSKKELLEKYKKGVMQRLFLSESGLSRLKDKQDENNIKSNPSILKSSKSRFRQIRFKPDCREGSDKDGSSYPDWEEKKLGDVCIMTSSKRVYLEDYVDSGIPFYRGKEITELKNKKEPTNILYISKKRYLDFKEKYGIPKIGDVLVTSVGTLGNVWKIDNDNPFYFKDGNLIWLKDIKENSDFIERLIQYNTNKLLKTSIGSTQKALTMVELRKLKFTFPTLPEQTQIAAFLSAIDKKIELVNVQIENTTTFKKGLLQKMFV